MAVVTVEGEDYTLTEEESAEFERLRAASVDPWRALQIATGDYQDIDPPIEPEEPKP